VNAITWHLKQQKPPNLAFFVRCVFDALFMAFHKDAQHSMQKNKPQRRTIYRVDPLAFFFCVFCLSALREARLDFIHTIQQHYNPAFIYSK
jgi:hypothetical protein